MNGCAQFAIEFIRVNPVAAFGLTQAQIIAICFVIGGSAGLFYVMKLGVRGDSV